MAKITYKEKLIIEKLFGMASGYVMDFSNRTFQEFIFDTLKIDIYDEKYDFNSGSKANRLRAFIQNEPNYKVGLLLENLLDYWVAQYQIGAEGFDYRDQDLHQECSKIAERLKKDILVEEIDVIKESEEDRDFHLLAKSIKESIEKHEPETGLDRLHTYLVKWIRRLCDKHKVEYKKEESLNAVFGKYVKFIVQEDYVESKMAEKILKFSINVIEAFNDIRNNRSFAHDNPVLNYGESLLIFNNVTNTIKFIESIEENLEKEAKDDQVNHTILNDDELPF
ncbi:abortive infection family protein [Salegentibacter maritimus]|uniref:abortive infection family protein n=1 Tax=Salegentibacter maritimus TaxID=2794347 RepID=UPI0018E4D907|nr:abortive infection family protein [Salegentibacter maritimus]MBI6117691.1 abortive infection family protein [Salegentibacter maritimus]